MSFYIFDKGLIFIQFLKRVLFSEDFLLSLNSFPGSLKLKLKNGLKMMEWKVCFLWSTENFCIQFYFLRAASPW